MRDAAARFVEVCPFRIRRDGGEYLVVRRAPGETVYPGLWQFVTGRVEKREKAPEAALRELREETGTVPARFWVVPAVNEFYDRSADAIRQVALFAAELEPAAAVRLSAEHDAFEWLPYAEARRRLVWPGQRNCLDIVRQYILGGEEAGRLLAIPL
ncbi:MAG TPA: NUDIX domain-containing protein [Bacteroidota bacterium]|nr:NUDIX domain-containing protein [Bacteroidota bacterium]